MSPRSAEFLARAHERSASAGRALAAGDVGLAVSGAYYAMLYAVRAALSEEDVYAKTHSGSWALFHRTFVEPGRFDSKLYSNAHATQQRREGVDYDAVMVEADEAVEIVSLADRFVAVVATLLGN